jgi:hypothetical protein
MGRDGEPRRGKGKEGGFGEGVRARGVWSKGRERGAGMREAWAMPYVPCALWPVPCHKGLCAVCRVPCALSQGPCALPEGPCASP